MGNLLIKNDHSIEDEHKSTVLDLSQWKKSIFELNMSKHFFDKSSRHSAYFLSDIRKYPNVIEICKGLYKIKLGYFEARSYHNNQQVFYTTDFTFEELFAINDPFVVISFFYCYSYKDIVYNEFTKAIYG